MRKKGFALLFTALSAAGCFAGNDTIPKEEYSYTPSALLFGIPDPFQLKPAGENTYSFAPFADFYTGSNCFTVKFTENFFGHGFISDEVKNDASSKLRNKNTIGIDFSTGALYMQKAEKLFGPGGYLLAGAQYNFEESSRFTRDLFHLTFYGNYDLQGQTADFSGSKFSLTSLLEYKLGFMKVYDQHYNTFQYGITAGLVQGLSGVDMKIKHGSLFTATDGTYLNLDYNFDLYTSGKNRPDLSKFTGTGFTFDIFGQMDLPEWGLRGSVFLNDLGAVFWDQNPTRITADTAFIFEGIAIDDLFTATDQAVGGETDSLFNLLHVEKGTKVFSQALPTRLNASITKSQTDGWYGTLGVQYLINTPYVPLIWAEAGKTFPPLKLTTSLNVHAGGYGNFNLGLEVMKQFGNFLQVKLGSNSLLGVFAPYIFTGAAGYVVIDAQL